MPTGQNPVQPKTQAAKYYKSLSLLFLLPFLPREGLVASLALAYMVFELPFQQCMEVMIPTVKCKSHFDHMRIMRCRSLVTALQCCDCNALDPGSFECLHHNAVSFTPLLHDTLAA